MRKIFKRRTKLKPGDRVLVLPAHKDRDYVPGRDSYTNRQGKILRIAGRWSSQLVVVSFSSANFFWFEPDELTRVKLHDLINLGPRAEKMVSVNDPRHFAYDELDGIDR